MSFYDALELLFDQTSTGQALALLGLVLCAYAATFRHRFRSMFDPLVYVLLLSAMSTTLLVLLTAHSVVAVDKLVFVLTTLGLFYAGFLLTDASRRRSVTVQSSRRRPTVTGGTLAVLFLVNFAVLVATYTFFGIPLFLESRLAQFVDSGGFGVLGRLATGLEFSMLMLAFIALQQRSAGRAWAKAILIQFVVAAVLSGSKGSLLVGLFSWYLSLVYAGRGWPMYVPLPRWIVGFLVLVVAAPLFVIFVQNPDGAAGFSEVFRLFAIRIAAEGDAYAYFLGGDLIDTVARHDWLAPLRQVLAAFRLVPAQTSINPGFEIIQEVLSVDSATTGPNSRLPIYILYFYGVWGIVLAPVLGCALGAVRNRMVKSSHRSPMTFAILAAVYFHCCKLEVDPQLTVAGLFGIALASPFFLAAWGVGHVQIQRLGGKAVPARHGPGAVHPQVDLR